MRSPTRGFAGMVCTSSMPESEALMTGKRAKRVLSTGRSWKGNVVRGSSRRSVEPSGRGTPIGHLGVVVPKILIALTPRCICLGGVLVELIDPDQHLPAPRAL